MCIYLKTRVIFIGSLATKVSYLKSKITLNVKSLLAHMPGMLRQVVSSRFLRSLSARQKPRTVFQGSHMWEKKRNQTGELHPVTWWGSTRQHDHCGWPAGVRAKGGLIWEQRMAYLKIQLRMVSRMLFYKMCILWLWALDLSLHFLIESVGCVHTDTSMPFLIFTIISYSFHYFFLYFL